MADSVGLQCSSLFLLPTHPSFSQFNTPYPSALAPLVICLSQHDCHLKLESENSGPSSNFGGEEIWLHLEFSYKFLANLFLHLDLLRQRVKLFCRHLSPICSKLQSLGHVSKHSKMYSTHTMQTISTLKQKTQKHMNMH